MNIGSFVARGFLLLALIAAAAQIAMLAPQMPAEVPAHFDAAGEPDRWSTRKGLVVTFIVIHAASLLTTLGMGYAIRWFPVSMVNLPNREYWLAPERSRNTYRVLFDLMCWVESGTILLMMGIFQLSYWVGVQQRTTINPEFFVLLGTYIAFVLGISAWIYIRFSRRNASSGN